MLNTLRDKWTIYHYLTWDERQKYVLFGDTDKVPNVALLSDEIFSLLKRSYNYG